ncbi:beta-phosphoglucomutase family hydrolase [Saccharospirillum alexandrii]|uniref:beta-phosphoglucomutase family hydrolase n=1 Tax=Saccharospirillum alexandrii TaxID=2448477 RepID=UPI000FDBAFDD|nr:beta-phosphoglucomutase family hydrolase [Saccharospirillum alexandrii]
MFDVTPFRGLVFDMDGTLVESGPLHEIAWRETLAKYHLPVNARLMHSLAGVPTRETLLRVAAETGYPLSAPVEEMNAFKEALVADLAPRYVKATRLEELAREHFGKLPMAVGTGAYTAEARDILNHCGILSLFDVVVGADQVTHPKPAPDTFLACAEQLGCSPGDCVVFEDADLGLEAARAAGMTAVDVRTEFQFINDYFLNG